MNAGPKNRAVDLCIFNEDLAVTFPKDSESSVGWGKDDIASQNVIERLFHTDADLSSICAPPGTSVSISLTAESVYGG